jgi:NAD(P)-dependent dehydrogenase (short-subunit alcohol dehydrogenase family)
VDGTFLGCHHGVRVMKERGGVILNMSSVSGIVGGHNLVAYNAAKGAVRLLTKSVALHCARQEYGIRCNSIHPGFVETRMLDDIAAGGRDPEALREKLRAGVPLGRNAEAGEVAALAAYLASDEAAFVTGAEFVIDGGVTAM